MKLLKDEKGLTLLEVVISMMILVMIALPLSSVFVASLRNNAQANMGTKLTDSAAQYMEEIKTQPLSQIDSYLRNTLHFTNADGAYTLTADNMRTTIALGPGQSSVENVVPNPTPSSAGLIDLRNPETDITFTLQPATITATETGTETSVPCIGAEPSDDPFDLTLTEVGNDYIFDVYVNNSTKDKGITVENHTEKAFVLRCMRNLDDISNDVSATLPNVTVNRGTVKVVDMRTLGELSTDEATAAAAATPGRSMATGRSVTVTVTDISSTPGGNPANPRSITLEGILTWK